MAAEYESEEAWANDEEDEQIGEESAKNQYLPYDPSSFSFLHMYRPQNDVVASLIANSGMEGVDRYEISRKLGINARTKAGNRSISNSIHAVMRTFPDNFGHFQKMEGKHRFIKYYVKREEYTPGGKMVGDCMAQFKEITGVECPFKLGETIKFPGENLSTLRISDVTLKRLMRILEHLYQEKVLIGRQKLEAYISNKEREEGYTFQIDRKSLKKCVLALSKRRLIKLMWIDVPERGEMVKVDIMTVPAITTSKDPLVAEALEKIVAEFKEQCKSFPTGTRLKQEQKEPQIEMEDEEPESPADESGSNVKREPTAAEGEETTLREDSLLNRTFNALQRLSFQKYHKTGAQIAHLSQRSINSLVDSARRRRMTKAPAGRKRRLPKHEIDGEESGEPQQETKRPIRKSLLHDTIDRQSLQHKAYLRSRFSQRERDMLLLIRSCSFFLNPVARFWPHPKVIRTLMHEFVPESRSKITYSLMAAGVRELKTKERYSHHQYIVKTMASYKELLDLRNQLARLNLAQGVIEGDEFRQKDYFFMDAFRTAYRLLFREATDFPSPQVSDGELRNYLAAHNLYFLSMSSNTQGTVRVMRSQKPLDKMAVRRSIAYNTILSVLLKNEDPIIEHSQTATENAEGENAGERRADFGNEPVVDDEEAEVSDMLMQQIGVQTLTKVLESMRTDGFITKKRKVFKSREEQTEEQGGPSTSLEAQTGEDECPTKSNRDTVPYTTPHLRCTNYFRHFFQPSYHKFLSQCVSQMTSRLTTNDNGCSSSAELIGEIGKEEDPGELLVVADHFSQNSGQHSINISAPNSLKDLFMLPSTEVGETSADVDDSTALNLAGTATKQLRYLESRELRLDLFRIRPERLGRSFHPLIESLPNPEEFIRASLIPADKLPKLTVETENEQNNQRPNGSELIDNAEPQRHALDSGDPALQQVYETLNRAGVVGLTIEELKMQMENLDGIEMLLGVLTASFHAICCGVDRERYVCTRNAASWLMRNANGQGFVPKPWILPSGQINWKVIAWMLEGVFAVVYSRPGLTIDELVAHFAFVLQPALAMELLRMLEELGCCTVCKKELTQMRKTSPFSDSKITTTVNIIQPSTFGMERIILFNEMKLRPLYEKDKI